MRNSSVRLVLAGGAALMLQMGSASAFPFFNKKNDQPAPSAPELQSQEAAASALLASAQAAQQAGKDSSALSTYKELVKKYPLTTSAATAQYQIGKSYEEGNPGKAFEEYQTLIDTYKASPYFTQALDSQFQIATRARTTKMSSFLGVKKKTSREDTIKLFTAVVQNAPQGKYAAEAKFRIGEIYEEDKARSEAINAFQDVVDQYPRSSFAAESQKKIADLNFGKVTEGTRDASAISNARKASQEAVSLFPTEEARDLLPQIDEKDAENAFGIAKFYEKSKNSKAAIIYYNEVLKFPGGTHFEDAKERVNELTTKDPGLLDQQNVKISNKQLALRAEADVKSRPDYLGPPAPADLEKKLSKPKMRTSGGENSIPIMPIEEPALPGEKPTGKPDDSLLKPGTPELALPPTAPAPTPNIVEPPLPETSAPPAALKK